jgi:hypothetical protein
MPRIVLVRKLKKPATGSRKSCRYGISGYGIGQETRGVDGCPKIGRFLALDFSST